MGRDRPIEVPEWVRNAGVDNGRIVDWPARNGAFSRWRELDPEGFRMNEGGPSDEDLEVRRRCTDEASRIARSNHWIAEAGVVQNLDSTLEVWMWWALTAHTLSDQRLETRWHVPIGKYTADFVVEGHNHFDDKLHVVIEVDGHDYHERSKEQARHDKERDRFMLRQGYHVMRFTGSEVYADVLSCAAQVFDFIDMYGTQESAEVGD